MKIWIIKEDLEWLEQMQLEGRTRQIEISSFPMMKDDVEMEIKPAQTNGDD